MESNGQTFDPEFHEALAEIPAPTEDMKGKVIDTVATGYLLKDKIARAGTSAAAHTITAAAIIMIGVFIVFVAFGVPTIQAAGLGAAIAVAASALLVQLAFMPSLIVLLGDRVWWTPRWLDRILPRIELD
jgi:uncharacterized membrane protein YdfJ with MMPL/SSD domain